MAILSAENHFRKGLAALIEDDPSGAATHFHAAIQIERQRAVSQPQMRYLSFYGYALALSQGANLEAIRACEAAAKREFYNADVHLNLGRVYLLAGKTTRALAAFERGLKLAPRHKALRAELEKIDRRGIPPLSMLSRDHPINIALGRMLAAIHLRSPRNLSPSRPASTP